MRYILGVLITILILAGATFTVLSIWDIYPLSLNMITKWGSTILIILFVLFFLYLLYSIFFRENKCNKDKGNKSHPIN